MTTGRERGGDTPAADGRRVAVRAVVAMVASFLLGGLTSYAQGFLPAAVSPLANSPSGWTLVTVLLVASVRSSTRVAALLGGSSFVLLTLGYTAVSQLRGLSYNPVFFVLVGVLVGPSVGVATRWLRATGLRVAAGTGLLAGIGVADAAYGLTVIRDSTQPTYWVAVGVAAVGLLVVMCAWRIRRPALIGVAGIAVLLIAGVRLMTFRHGQPF